MSAKRRTDAFDASLSDEQRWALFDQGKRLPWYEAVEWLAKEYGASKPGKTAFYEFMTWMRSQESERRIVDAIAAKEDIRRSMDQVGDMDPELAHAWQQLALESVLKGDPEAGKRYLDMAMELRKAALEHSKLELKKAAEQRAGESLALAKAQFQEKLRGDLERGLQALYEQVANNEQAVALVRQLQALLGGEAA